DAIAAVSATAGVQVALATNVHTPVHARADARRLHQCIVNLLQNAITHTPSHGRITVDVIRNTDHATIVVEDTGSGIPPEHVPLVFDRFHRVDPSRARTSGGMGLGLAVVRELVTGMGGRVWAESTLDVGSRFVIELHGTEPHR
ncbi:MAG TPA: ATP-binding protein, partial [Gemmatimonas sp.]|nr:ATP-binding protein [Gemmatimonas sp.]